MKTISIKDKQYKLGEFDERLLADFHRWACEQLPDPLEQIASSINGFPRELQEVMVREAMQVKRRVKSLNDPDVRALMETPQGAAKIVSLIWSKHNSELTEDQSWELHKEAIAEHGENYLSPPVEKTTEFVVRKKK